MFNKINVIGSSGSGKSTFSARLAKELDIEHIEMDSIFWGENWYFPSDEEFLADLSQAINKDRWVLDGNYSRSNALKWADVDTIIWIDFSFSRTLYQSFTRAIKRIYSGKEIWPETGNKETFKKAFLSKDSIILWMISNYRRNRIRYAELMNNEEYSHINFIRLTSPSECSDFFQNQSNFNSPSTFS